MSFTHLCLQTNSLQKQDPYVFPSLYSTGCSACSHWALCITNRSASSTEGKHLPERAGGSGTFLLAPCYCTSKPCSHLQEQNVKTSLNVRPHVKLVSPTASIPHGAGISHCRIRRRRNVLLFPMHAEHKSFVSPRDHRAPSSSWMIRNLKFLLSCLGNSYPAAVGDQRGCLITLNHEEGCPNWGSNNLKGCFLMCLFEFEL